MSREGGKNASSVVWLHWHLIDDRTRHGVHKVCTRDHWLTDFQIIRMLGLDACVGVFFHTSVWGWLKQHIYWSRLMLSTFERKDRWTTVWIVPYLYKPSSHCIVAEGAQGGTSAGLRASHQGSSNHISGKVTAYLVMNDIQLPFPPSWIVWLGSISERQWSAGGWRHTCGHNTLCKHTGGTE